MNCGFVLQRRYGRARFRGLMLTLSSEDKLRWRAGGKGRAKIRALAQAKANRMGDAVEIVLPDERVLVMPEKKS